MLSRPSAGALLAREQGEECNVDQVLRRAVHYWFMCTVELCIVFDLRPEQCRPGPSSSSSSSVGAALLECGQRAESKVHHWCAGVKAPALAMLARASTE